MIWIVGCNGMLGKELKDIFDKNSISHIESGREVDITNYDALLSFAEKQKEIKSQYISFIVNCAAYTAVDKAEDDIDACRMLNAAGAGNIAKAAKTLNAMLIHISTDYVFDGRSNKPYKEDDPKNPTGVYGAAKFEGENAVLNNCPDSYIIRTAWLYGRYGKNFVQTMVALMNSRTEINVVNDQKGCPTWTQDLCGAIVSIIQNKPDFGVYHYTNEDVCTWFEFAAAIYKAGREFGIIKNQCLVKPCTSAEYPSKVTRPAYSVLDKTKIKAALNIQIPGWKESLLEYLKQVSNE
ncbi:NAD(P)-dependent oxidoreductase [Spirochaetia bacterium]|nr:NAD(P)-dependent oxidoreductase [Spirochaetia bacterium]